MAVSKQSRRAFLRSSALTVAGVLLAGCGQQAPKVVKETEVVKETVVIKETSQAITKVVTATPAPRQQVTIRMFNPMDPLVFSPFGVDLVAQRYPQAKLELVYLQGSWGDVADQLMTMIAGGENMDIIGMATEGIGIMGGKKILAPLQPFLDADAPAAQDFNSDMHPTLMKAMKWQGDQLLLPYGWNNMLIHYNYKLFQQLGVPEPKDGWTWDDFAGVCKSVADVKGTKDDRYAFSFGSSAFSAAPWYFNNDTSWLKNDMTDSNLDDPKVVETVQFLADLILKYKVAPNPQGWDERGNFVAGHLAMRACGGWCIGPNNAAKFYDYNFQYYPHKAGKLKTVVGVGGYAISKASRYPKDAWEVMKIILSKEGQLQYSTVDGSPPARKSVASMPQFMDKAKPSPADMSIFYQSLDYGALVPAPSNSDVIDALLERYYQQIWNGELGVEPALKKAHVELQAEMDKLKTKKP